MATTKARKKARTKKRRRPSKVDHVEIAKRALPNWVVSDQPASNVKIAQVDATTPALDQLRKKYENPKGSSVRANTDGSTSKKKPVNDQRGGLVVMRPTNPQDSRGKPLSVYVDEGKVKGIQG
jgi:hypothetical protein